MSFVMNLVLVAQILSALGMVGLILVQHGKGADMGAAFGSGSSGSLFGASGSANFLSRSTAVLATVFLASTLLLSYYGFSPRVEASGGSVLEGVKAPETVQPDAAAAIPAGAAASHATPQNEGKPANTFAAFQKPKTAEFAVGDRVENERFGKGVVTGVEDMGRDWLLTVNFDEMGVKKMFAGFINLKKLE